MTGTIRTRAAIVLPIILSGCAGHTKASPFNVVVRGSYSSCAIEVAGRKVSTDELLAIARPEAKSGKRAQIGSDMAETPYRCLGGTIYVLQMAGFKDIGFVGEPAPDRP